ncbi:Z-ring associated protein ZapG [Parasalinivibrio latis]|uniref:Z-ring associated protein ZapG n=1 Tax=Parasalinivibrio latis TaxID=2952610 RepID=UPI0030E4F358
MAWINGLVLVAVGIVVGFLLARITRKNADNAKALQKELDKTKYELEQYRQDLVDHFAQSAKLLESISKDYAKLHQHMAKTSSDLMPDLPEQDNPFTKPVPELIVAEAPQEPPRDYSEGATGLLKGESAERKAS